MEASKGASVCGICGRPLEAGHAHNGQSTGAPKTAGKVEYVVVGRRGVIVDFQRADDAAKTLGGDAATLAMQLGIDESSLIGTRFSCWVEPDDDGVTRSDFRPISAGS